MVDEYLRVDGKILTCPSCSEEMHVGNIYADDLSRCANCIDEMQNCSYCQESKGRMHPSHFASPRCQSGSRNHCTCDACF